MADTISHAAQLEIMLYGMAFGASITAIRLAVRLLRGASADNTEL